MPGGFENSAMKSSFSLSSLQPSSLSLETPEHARPERPYNSLRKTCRKDPEKDSWRRSWDRKEDTQDEFWIALEPNYLYLMDSNLIDSCKEAGRDLHYGGSSPSLDWSFEQFCSQFTELDLWLTSIQETIYSKEENVTDRNLRLTHVEEMHRKTYKRKVFNNQGGRLAARFPELREDVKWRMTHLNRKWERLEQTVTPRKRSHPDHLTHAIDVEHELNCLRKWLRLTDRRLLPLNLQTTMTWTLTELEAKAKEHQVIQREVELHGKIVSCVLRRCERLVRVEEQGRRFDPCQVTRTARDLERRWQLLFIRSLEWVCHIDNLLSKRTDVKSPTSAICVESDEGEPVLKHPRLSSSPWPQYHNPAPTSQDDVDGDCLMDVNPSWTEDMVGPQSEINLPFSSPPPLPDLLNRAGSMEISTSEDMLNKNFSFHKSDFDHCRSRRQSVPLDTSRKLFADENRSTQKAPNIGNFYYKHCDTDDGNTESEQDERLMDMDSKNAEESSDEEWTFKCGGEGGEDSSAQNEASSLCQSTETLSPAPKTRQEMLPKDELKKLIDGAEPIAIHASPIRKSRDFSPLILDANRAKRKVNEWMSKAHPDDRKTQGESYDATWEYTTEEEERHSSGDFDTSVIHCSQSAETMPAMDSPVLEKASPSTVTSSTPDHFKVSPVVLRAKRKDVTTKRPLSESGLPQLSSDVDRLLQTRSESALNQMDHTPTQSVKMDTSVHGTLSSSTTVEEILCQTQEGSGGGYSSNSLRKRKIKLRKRNQGRKSDSGSDHREPPSPLKAIPMIRRVVTSGTETEEESEADKLRGVHRRPMFRLGPEGGPVTTFRVAPCGDKALSAESSLSTDQAWDSYQEKYVSEAYSEETADQETTRKLLDFGDDYRNFIDSQSDGASSLGLSQPYPTLKNGLRPGHTSSHRRRRQALDRDSPDHSDKESKEVSKIISHSLSSLEVCEESLAKLSSTNPHLVLATDFNDILVKCKANIEVLNSTMDCFVDTTWCVKECPEIKGLIEKWQGLEERSQQLQKMRSLQREMAKLKEELLEINERVSSTDHDDLQDRDQLQMKIFQIKGEQSVLRECKPRLVEVNTAVHKFFTDSGQHEVAARLKDAVKELYYVWEETNKRVTHRLESLNQVSAAWQIFECNLSELKAALLRDQQTLGLLDHALQQGPVSQDVASSVIDVAKVLSEKQDLCFQSVGTLTSSSVTQVSLSLPASTEGSLSDSGISDSGSEQECERERRLSALRRLARQLESLLSPNSQAILDMTRRIEQAEVELRGLQETCRNLIVRTAASADAWQRQDLPPTNLPSQPDSTLVNRSKKNVSSGPQSFMELDPDDDPDPSKNSVGWLWRVIRAALPFQMAILAIFCVACLLEPHCCDSMNNLNFSLTPQLRYMRGPPPV